LGTAGTFVAPDTLEEFSEVVVVPVRVMPTRTLWPEGGFSRDSGPECSSRDGISAVLELPDGTIPLFPGQFCSQCEFFASARWQLLEGQRWCEPGYDVILLNLETLELLGFRLRGTARKIAPVLAAPKVFGKQLVRLASQKVTKDYGSWYQMTAVPLGPVTEQQAGEVEEMLKAFSSTNGA
jgi:hypothetical protein